MRVWRDQTFVSLHTVKGLPNIAVCEKSFSAPLEYVSLAASRRVQSESAGSTPIYVVSADSLPLDATPCAISSSWLSRGCFSGDERSRTMDVLKCCVTGREEMRNVEVGVVPCAWLNTPRRSGDRRRAGVGRLYNFGGRRSSGLDVRVDLVYRRCGLCSSHSKSNFCPAKVACSLLLHPHY